MYTNREYETELEFSVTGWNHDELVEHADKMVRQYLGGDDRRYRLAMWVEPVYTVAGQIAKFKADVTASFSTVRSTQTPIG